MATTVDVPAEQAADPPRAAGPRPLVLAGIAAAIAVLCGLALPLAPVVVSEPTVSWPREPGRPASTVLALTGYRPLALDVRFSCAVARRAGADGVVVATTRPGLGAPGLQVSALTERVRIRFGDRVLLDEPMPAGTCGYRISGRSAGRPTFLAGPPSPVGRLDGGVPIGRAPPETDRYAGPDNAELVIERDGRLRAAVAVEQLPDVDLLLTSLGPLPTELADQLAVTLRIDDEFSSRPTPVKMVLTVGLGLGLVGCGLALLLADRGRPRRAWRWAWPRWIDLLVPATLTGWLFVAPATDDDGWFATQARNAASSGDVGNYYQLYDLSYTPFSWLYQALSGWQQLTGTAPVPQRIPALVCGLLGWLVLRRFAAVGVEPAGPGESRSRLAAAVPAVLGIVYLAWWLPYGMGVRPEPVVAFLAVATLLAVLAAGRSGRLVMGWLACLSAGIALATHPTGLIALGPLLAGLPLLSPQIHRVGDPAGTALRALAVGSGLAVASLLGFADGALRDFRRAQAITDSMLPLDGWTDELQRYVFLLDPIPMGSYAKRAAVLACLLALAWYAVLAAAAWARRVTVPTPLALAAGSTGLGFAALAFAPSKWSHHFGALAGVGSAFLALLLVFAVPLTRRVLAGSRLPIWCLGLAGGSAVGVIALGWRGPNSWPYAWLDGMRTPYLPPSVLGVELGGLLLWAAVLVGLGFVLVRVGRGARRLRGLAAVPVLVVLSLLANLGYLVGSFGSAALRGVPPGSIWAQAVADPAGAQCGSAATVRVLDPTTARPLPVADPGAASTGSGFVPGGYHPSNPPQGGPAWGSFLPQAGQPAERNLGQLTTGWFTLPVGLPEGAGVAVLAAGSLDEGTTLTARYARRPAELGAPAELAAPVELGVEPLTDPARSDAWRTFVLTPPRGAELVRLEAVDASAAGFGWLAFTAPAVQRPVPLAELPGAGRPVALGWQLAFGFPCLRPPVVIAGLTEPPDFAVVRGEQALGGLADLAWAPPRGGVFAHVPRSRPVLQLATVGPVDPYLQVYRFGEGGLRRDGYRLTIGSREVGYDSGVGH